MAQLRSKQIFDFNSNINWSTVTNTDIPNSFDIKDQFIGKDQMVVDQFNDSYNSSGGTWSLVLSENVLNNDPDLVTVYVNGLKTNGVLSISGTPSTLTINQYFYDIDPNDILNVHYVRVY
jgi:hypothetical protein